MDKKWAYTKKVIDFNQKMNLIKQKAVPPPFRKFQEKTNPEKLMAKLLDSLYIEYEDEYAILFAREWKFYDFKIGDNILIEVDGDYWHTNPDSFKMNKSFKKQNKRNDILKNFIAKKRGFILLRFWEKDINENIEQVAAKILETIEASKNGIPF